MKKKLCVFLLIFLLFSSLCVPAFATTNSNSPDSSESGGWPAFDAIGDFLKGLFIPSSNYFQRKTAEMNQAITQKMGGLADLFNIINYFFNSLNDSSTVNFSLTIPKGNFFPNSSALKADLFSVSGISNMISSVKGIMNAFICILTAIVSYHKLRKLFEVSGG